VFLVLSKKSYIKENLYNVLSVLYTQQKHRLVDPKPTVRLLYFIILVTLHTFCDYEERIEGVLFRPILVASMEPIGHGYTLLPPWPVQR
jgi:hypothetical protein